MDAILFKQRLEDMEREGRQADARTIMEINCMNIITTKVRFRTDDGFETEFRQDCFDANDMRKLHLKLIKEYHSKFYRDAWTEFICDECTIETSTSHRVKVIDSAYVKINICIKERS